MEMGVRWNLGANNWLVLRLKVSIYDSSDNDLIVTCGLEGFQVLSQVGRTMAKPLNYDFQLSKSACLVLRIFRLRDLDCYYSVVGSWKSLINYGHKTKPTQYMWFRTLKPTEAFMR